MATKNPGVGQGVGGGAPIKHDEAFCDALADQFLEYALKDDSLTMQGFTAITGFDYREWKVFAGRSEKFRQTLKRVRAIIGNRREAGAVVGDLNNTMVAKGLWQYDPEVRNREDERDNRAIEKAKLADQLDNSEDLVNDKK